MAKFAGAIGFVNTVETEPGIWKKDTVEKKYTGDVLGTSLRYQNDSKINEDITISKRISIIADIFFNKNIDAIQYVTYLGVKWAVNELDVQYPRVILTLGGIYNA